MKDRHEWTDAIGGKWALETSEDQHVTTIEGFMSKNLGGQPMLHLPGMMGGQTIQDELSREILRLAAEVERLRAEREWRPIETAPKDGTEVLLWVREPAGSGDGPNVMAKGLRRVGVLTERCAPTRPTHTTSMATSRPTGCPNCQNRLTR